MKIKAISSFTMRGGDRSILNKEYDLDDEYCRYLINQGLGAPVNEIKTSDQVDSASERTDKPRRSKRAAKNTKRAND